MKTSESAAATTDADTCAATSGASAAGNTKPSNVNKRPKSIPEAKFLMWEVHQRIPAWKAVKLIESNKDDQVDLAALGEATGILFDSREMLSEAVQCLERIREQDGKKDDKSGARRTSDSPSVHEDDQEVSDDSGSDDPNTEEESHDTPEGDAPEEQDTSGDADGASKQNQESSSKEPESSDQKQDASASSSDTTTKKKAESESESHEFIRVTNEGQDVLQGLSYVSNTSDRSRAI